MKKQYMLIIALVISAITARAQSSYTTIPFNNIMQPALVLELPNTTNDVEGAILEKLKQIGYDPETKGHLFWKKNKKDGFYVFSEVQSPSLSDKKIDIYFKVIKKSNEEKNNSTLYLLVSNGNESFASPERDSILWSNSKVFLDGFLDKTTAYSLEQSILNQENTIKDSQKKLSGLQSDEKDLSEKISKYQKDLLNNQGNQKDQQQDIENQKKLLESLILKRKA